MCHITTIYHSCSHPDLNFWTIHCSTGLKVDPNCCKDSSSYPCEKTSSIWTTPFRCTRCSKPVGVPKEEMMDLEELYEEGMCVDEEERCDLALDDEEMERMDRELDEWDSEVDDVDDMDISESVTPVLVHSSSSESRKRKLTQSALYNRSGDLERGRADGPRKRRESKHDGETMRGRTKQRAVVGIRRAGRRSTRRR